MTGLTVVEAATVLPVSLAETKQHLRVEHDVDDSLITGMIQAAGAFAERFMGRALVETIFDFYLDSFPAQGQPILIPRPPLIEVGGLFVAGEDEETEFDTFYVDTASAPGRLYLAADGSWPTADYGPAGIRVRYRAGYVRFDGSPPVQSGEIPADIRAALLLYVGSLYMQRESITVGNTATAVPWATETLLRQHRVEPGTI